MTIERIDGILNFNADMTMTAAMAALLLVFGYFVRDKVKFLKNIVSQHLLLADSYLCL